MPGKVVWFGVPHLSPSAFCQCPVVYCPMPTGYCDTIWVVPGLYLTHFLIPVIAFTVAILLDGDLLFQPGLPSEKEAMPDDIASKGLWYNQSEEKLFPIFSGRSMEITESPQGPPQRTDFSEVASVIHGEFGSGGPARSQDIPRLCLCQPGQRSKLVPIHRELCRCGSVTQYLQKKKIQNIL